MRGWALSSVLVLAAAVLAPKPADAFCGFYVSGADGKLFNEATQVVLMREGTRTVLSMQNDYTGPPEDFALVVPVPVVLQKENVKTLSADLFKRVDTLSAPRLVEYWEQDPCPPEAAGAAGLGGLGGSSYGSGHGRLGGAYQESVKIEAQFEVGEYEIVVLSAADGAGLDRWLRDGGYKIPENAERAFVPYVQAGSKFFVAKVNAAKVKFENGVASLSPLRFHYDAESFELPVKLGLLNSKGVQDLIVHVLATDRYEVANYPNVTIPTNLDVSEAARSSFGTFYASLFDRTLETHQGAVVTEYAWPATSCDPCPGGSTGLSTNDIASLGADVIPGTIETVTEGSSATPAPRVREGLVEITPGLSETIVRRVVRQNLKSVRDCYEAGLGTAPNLEGRIPMKFEIGAKGQVGHVKTDGATLPDRKVVECVTNVFAKLTFPPPEGNARVQVVYPLSFLPPNFPTTTTRPVVRRNFTLSRLHVRYTKDALGSDLVFRKADPIVGGREEWTDGKLELGATKTTSRSTFQARYAIRHTWPGPITCKEPVRGRWGRAWPDAGPPGEHNVESASKTAYAPRGGVSLGSFTNPNVTGLDAVLASAPSEASATKTSAPDAGDGRAARASRCGCRAVGHDDGSPRALACLALLATLGVRRRRRS